MTDKCSMLGIFHSLQFPFKTIQSLGSPVDLHHKISCLLACIRQSRDLRVETLFSLSNPFGNYGFNYTSQLILMVPKIIMYIFHFSALQPRIATS